MANTSISRASDVTPASLHPRAVPLAIAAGLTATCGPPLAMKKARQRGTLTGPGGADNQEEPTETGAASVGQSRHPAALVFPATKTEATAAARLALIGWALNRAELAGAYVATRWDSEPVTLSDLAAVTAFVNGMVAPE